MIGYWRYESLRRASSIEREVDEEIQEFREISVLVNETARLLLLRRGAYKMRNEVRYIIRSQVINSFIHKCQFCSFSLVFNVTQPHSLYKFNKDTERVKPVTILAASF